MIGWAINLVMGLIDWADAMGERIAGLLDSGKIPVKVKAKKNRRYNDEYHRPFED